MIHSSAQQHESPKRDIEQKKAEIEDHTRSDSIYLKPKHRQSSSSAALPC